MGITAMTAQQTRWGQPASRCDKQWFVSEASKLQGAPLIVIEVDPGLRVTAWNRRAELVFGTDASSAVGRDLAAVLPLAEASVRALLDADDDEARVWSVRHGEATVAFEACCLQRCSLRRPRWSARDSARASACSRACTGQSVQSSWIRRFSR